MVLDPGELCSPRPVAVTVVMVTFEPVRKLMVEPVAPLAPNMPSPTCWIVLVPAAKLRVAPSLTRIPVPLPTPITESPPMMVLVAPGATTKGASVAADAEDPPNAMAAATGQRTKGRCLDVRRSI